MADPGRAEYIFRTMARSLAVFSVILSAWLFGSADGWNYLLICQLITLSLILWFLSMMIASQVRLRVPGLTGLILLLTAYVGIQIIPLPRQVVSILNPFSARVQAASMAVLDNTISQPDQDMSSGKTFPEAASINGSPEQQISGREPGFVTISLCPGETLRSLYLLIAYFGTFVVIANCIRSWDQLRNSAILFVISGFFMSVLGIIHKFSGSTAIIWFHTPRWGGDIFGPFTNPNHFAAYINMLIGVGLGLYLSSSRIREALGWHSWRDRMAWLSTRRASGTALSVFAVSVMGGAVCTSLSRGGITSLVAAGGIAFFLTTFFAGVKRKARFRLIAGSILVVAAVIWLGWRPVLEELLTLETVVRNPVDDARFVATRDTLQIFGSCPLFGSGFGSFSHVFPVFQSESLHFGRWLHAHNDWAELLAEGGIIGSALVLLVIAKWARCIVTQFTNIKAKSELMILGLAIGFLAMAVHSFWDYGLHKPGNMFLLVALAGMAVAAVYVGQPPDVSANGRPQANPRCSSVCSLGTVLARGLTLSLIAAMVVLSFLQNRALRGELAFSRFIYAQKLAQKMNTMADATKILLEASVEFDRTVLLANDNPDALREMTAFQFSSMVNRQIKQEARLQFANRARTSALLAVMAAPSDYLAWLWLARVEATMGLWRESEACLERARSLVAPAVKVSLFKAAN
jgi:hypothetical protein